MNQLAEFRRSAYQIKIRLSRLSLSASYVKPVISVFHKRSYHSCVNLHHQIKSSSQKAIFFPSAIIDSSLRINGNLLRVNMVDEQRHAQRTANTPFSDRQRGYHKSKVPSWSMTAISTDHISDWIRMVGDIVNEIESHHRHFGHDKNFRQHEAPKVFCSRAPFQHSGRSRRSDNLGQAESGPRH